VEEVYFTARQSDSEPELLHSAELPSLYARIQKNSKKISIMGPMIALKFADEPQHLTAGQTPGTLIRRVGLSQLLLVGTWDALLVAGNRWVLRASK